MTKPFVKNTNTKKTMYQKKNYRIYITDDDMAIV